MLVNDKEVNFKGNLKELLLSLNYPTEKIVVLVNGEIVKKENWDNVELRDEDYIEIVSLVGGG
ncbi:MULTISPECIES: sulfur carrier protein ThiS [Dictyoglomus]|jgi:sulfur carrier protein|uniref:Thiamine biosynthesis protein ThiS n=1 Tax=Dictyoglomus turgidum (strain DSM 6724 / Z-1310) TaxID=515635 RepID=B8E354_DICTD|nr:MULTISPECIES: sulfur carrier protein ThiS [Dictyoglomus]ACK42928.1 thiamine biosynthesis protein ThiS [Dictyoglomus turgidum DSM 6724]PNV80443.1 MAG: thiamine biosynthesis protein ThiS [Dictyoglomus turgidum]HBU30992.1 thiamine biosynthesis protein ThiS [Dictyoglomus sp.]